MNRTLTTESTIRFHAPSNRRRGFVTLYLALSLVVLLGISSLVVDLGIAYQKRAYMQKAADASALAGAAYASVNQGTTTTAIANAATDFARNNYGYATATMPNSTGATAIVSSSTDTTVNGVTTTDYNTGTVLVNIIKPQPTLFARIFRINIFKSDSPMVIDAMNISTTATAAFTIRNDVATGISGTSDGYGLNSKATANLSLMGPLASTNRGDSLSARYTSSTGSNNGTMSVNSRYTPAVLRPVDDRDPSSSGYGQATFKPGENFPVGNGYYFDFIAPANSGKFAVQIYDPGNADQNTDATTLYNKRWNETDTSTNSTRAPAPDGTMRAVTTKTLFQVWSDNGTPNIISDDVRVSSQVYADESQYSQKWVNTCVIDPASYAAGAKFYMNATTIDGNGKNGFNLRLNRVDASNNPIDTDATYATKDPLDPTITIGNGTNITTRGILPINFGSTGTADLSLGYVPAGATQVKIKRFDVDVGTSGGGFSVNYKTTPVDLVTKKLLTAQARTTTGNFGLGGGSANDVTQEDTINLTTLYPGGYPGGTWSLSYSAGTSDQSTWTMEYVGPPSSDNTTKIRLIK